MKTDRYLPVKRPTVNIPKPVIPEPQKLVFSFKFYDDKHKTSKNVTFRNPYPIYLLKQLKEMENWTVEIFKGQQKAKTFRVHPIDWTAKSVAFNGFGLKKEYNENAWQFTVSGNKYGRVHGFFIEHIFHVVWLDPKHKVYPRR